MIPQKGQYVKIYFRNETQLEGIIESWSNSQAILITEESGSACIIMNVLEDVMLVKIMQPKEEESLVEQEQYFNELEEEFEEVKEMPSEDDLRLKKLSELKDLMNKQERKIIYEKLVDHIPGSDIKWNKNTKLKDKVDTLNKKYIGDSYGYPDFFKK